MQSFSLEDVACPCFRGEGRCLVHSSRSLWSLVTSIQSVAAHRALIRERGFVLILYVALNSFGRRLGHGGLPPTRRGTAAGAVPYPLAASRAPRGTSRQSADGRASQVSRGAVGGASAPPSRAGNPPGRLPSRIRARAAPAVAAPRARSRREPRATPARARKRVDWIAAGTARRCVWPPCRAAPHRRKEGRRRLPRSPTLASTYRARKRAVRGALPGLKDALRARARR